MTLAMTRSRTASSSFKQMLLASVAVCGLSIQAQNATAQESTSPRFRVFEFVNEEWRAREPNDGVVGQNWRGGVFLNGDYPPVIPPEGEAPGNSYLVTNLAAGTIYGNNAQAILMSHAHLHPLNAHLTVVNHGLIRGAGGYPPIAEEGSAYGCIPTPCPRTLIELNTLDGSVSVVNSGLIDHQFSAGTAILISTSNSISIVNSGVIQSPDEALVVGTQANEYSGSVTINNSGTITGRVYVPVANTDGSQFTNSGTWNTGGGPSRFGGTFLNRTARSQLNVQGDLVVDGLITNYGGIYVAADGVLTTSTGLTVGRTGSVLNYGTINDDLHNAGVVTNHNIYNAIVASNTGTINNFYNWAGSATNSPGGTIVNAGTWTGDLENHGVATNYGVWDGNVLNEGTFNAVGGSVITGLFSMAPGSTLSLQNGSAGDRVSFGSFNPNGGVLLFDFNSQTHQADTIVVASAISPTGTSQVGVNVVTPNVAPRAGVSALVDGGGAAPAPLAIGQAPVATANYQFAANGNPTSSIAEYYLVQSGDNGLYLGYRPTANENTIPPVTAPSAQGMWLATHEFAGQILDSGVGGFSGGGVVQVTPLFGVYASGRLGNSWHDGYNLTINNAAAAGNSVDFSTRDTSFLAAAEVDVGKWAGLKNAGFKIGALTGWAHTSIDFGSNEALRTIGLFDAGGGSNDAWLYGGYGLVTAGQFYGLGLVTGALGGTDINNAVLASTGSYDTSGVVAGVLGGVIVPATQIFGTGAPKDVAFDFRSGISWSSYSGDSFIDSRNNRFGETKLDMTTGTLAAKVFSVTQIGSLVWRPFFQGGVNHRFDYENTAVVADTKLFFKDVDTTYYVTTGSEVDVSSALKATISGRGDFNEDQRSFSGTIGMKYSFN